MSKITRRTVLAGAAAVPFVTKINPARAQAKTIRIWTFIDPNTTVDPRAVVFKKLITSFEEKNPGLKIVVEPQNWTQMTDKFFVAHQTNTAPDIMWVLYHRIPAAIELGALANLDELFAKNKLMTAEDYDDLAGRYLEFGAKPGAHYHIMHSRSFSGMLYHSNYFKEAGVDASKLTTWDAFIDAAKKLTVKDSTGKITRYGFGQVFTTVATQPSVTASVIMDKEGKLFDDNRKARFATPAGIEGMNMQIDMVRKHEVTSRDALSLSGEDLFDVFTSNRAAMILSNTARIPRLRGIIKSDTVEFLPFPSFTAGKASPTEAQGWPNAVWSGSKMKDEAAAFIAHISSKEADKMWVLEAGAVPIRKSTVTGNPAFFADPTKQYLAKIADVMREFVWFPPNHPKGGYNEELDKAAQAILANNQDVKAALTAAENNFNRTNGYA